MLFVKDIEKLEVFRLEDDKRKVLQAYVSLVKIIIRKYYLFDFI